MSDPQDLAPLDFTTAQPLGSEPPLVPQPKPRNAFFFGRFGLRAGYGIAIFIVFYAVITVVASIFAVAATGKLKEVLAVRAYVSAHPHAPKPSIDIPFVPALVIVNDAVAFLGMLVVCWFFAKAERRQLFVYGIGRLRAAEFLAGSFWGLAALSVLVLALWSQHLLYFDSLAIHGFAIVLYGLKWLIAFLFVGFAEEYFFRGYLLFAFTRGFYGLAEKISPANAHNVAYWLAAGFMSLLFGALHLGNKGENALGIFQVVLVGFVFSYVLWRTGSLWWAIGFHMAWDWAQSFLYGVADSGNVSVGRLFQTHVAGKPLLSGGVDGPEGSVLCVPVMLLMLLVIRFTTRRGELPPLEPAPTSEITTAIA